MSNSLYQQKNFAFVNFQTFENEFVLKIPDVSAYNKNIVLQLDYAQYIFNKKGGWDDTLFDDSQIQIVGLLLQSDQIRSFDQNGLPNKTFAVMNYYTDGANYHQFIVDRAIQIHLYPNTQQININVILMLQIGQVMYNYYISETQSIPCEAHKPAFLPFIMKRFRDDVNLLEGKPLKYEIPMYLQFRIYQDF